LRGFWSGVVAHNCIYKGYFTLHDCGDSHAAKHPDTFPQDSLIGHACTTGTVIGPSSSVSTRTCAKRYPSIESPRVDQRYPSIEVPPASISTGTPAACGYGAFAPNSLSLEVGPRNLNLGKLGRTWACRCLMHYPKVPSRSAPHGLRYQTPHGTCGCNAGCPEEAAEEGASSATAGTSLAFLAEATCHRPLR
jgi:hypothetical protein